MRCGEWHRNQFIIVSSGRNQALSRARNYDCAAAEDATHNDLGSPGSSENDYVSDTDHRLTLAAGYILVMAGLSDCHTGYNVGSDCMADCGN